MEADGFISWITVIGGIFALSGGGLLGAAVREFARRRAFVAGSVTAPGTIVALTESPDRDTVSYFPKVKFRAASGREIEFDSGAGSSADEGRIGATVTVRYRPDRPDMAEIDDFLSLWGLALLFGVLGAAFLLVGIGLLTGALPV